MLHNRDNTINTAVTNPLYIATSVTTNKADMTQSVCKEHMHDITKCSDNMSKEQAIELKNRPCSSAYQNIIQNLYNDNDNDDDDDDVSIQSKYASCDQLDGNVVSNAEEMGMHSCSQKPSAESKHLNSEAAAASVTNVNYEIPVNTNLQPTKNDHLLENASQGVECFSLDTAHTGETGYEGKACQSPPKYVTPGDIPASS